MLYMLHSVLLGPAQVYEAQARLVAANIIGKYQTPTYKTMEDEIQLHEATREKGEREFLGLRTQTYVENCCKLAGVPSTYEGMAANDPSRQHLKGVGVPKLPGERETGIVAKL